VDFRVVVRTGNCVHVKTWWDCFQGNSSATAQRWGKSQNIYLQWWFLAQPCPHRWIQDRKYKQLSPACSDAAGEAGTRRPTVLWTSRRVLCVSPCFREKLSYYEILPSFFSRPYAMPFADPSAKTITKQQAISGNEWTVDIQTHASKGVMWGWGSRENLWNKQSRLFEKLTTPRHLEKPLSSFNMCFLCDYISLLLWPQTTAKQTPKSITHC
jgi:hypothetical protein